MKESRIIIFILSFLICILIPISIVIFPNEIVFNITCNIFCGAVVGLVTALCQFFSSKRKIVNRVYNIYLDLYRTYYFSNNKKFLGHINSLSIYQKFNDLSPRVNEILDDYHGFFKEKDKMYVKMNPKINIEDKYTAKKIIKSFKWFNEKSFDESLGSFIIEIEKILRNINSKRFDKDKDNIKNMFNYMWGIKD